MNKPVNFHTHTTEDGFLVKCYHNSKSVLFSGAFWFGVTVSFPLEHFIWERLYPFKLITEWLGL